MKKTKVPGGNELLNPEKTLKEELGLTYGSHVGDFGCGGAGYFVLQSAMMVGPEGKVCAVDIQKPVLSNIETRAQLYNLHNIKTVWANLEKYNATKIESGSLDFGLLINILFQNNDHETIIREAIRMVKQGGRLLVIDWKSGRFPFGPKEEDKIKLDTIREMGRRLNLREIKIFDAGTFHFGVVFEKQ